MSNYLTLLGFFAVCFIIGSLFIYLNGDESEDGSIE